MQLKSIKFTEFEGTPQEWTLERLTLGPKNLVVGKNASGKSRTLNVIASLAANLAGLKSPGLSADYEVEFSHDGKLLRYQLKYKDNQVVEEKLSINEDILLDRKNGGEGTIWAAEIDNGKMVRFQTPPSELAAVTRRDTIQHMFLEPLYEWGASLRHYQFGTPLGKDHLAVFVKEGGRKFDERDPNAIVALYRQAEKDFKDNFKQAVIKDMASLDYDIDDIGVMSPVTIRILSPPLGEMVGLYVKERGLAGVTDQPSMSQGMFRALSIIVQFNYSLMTKAATCILVDDIGEGLDFDRSCRLIDLLRKKSMDSNVQLVLSTNDRFVMNHVPLEEWAVLQRQGGHVRVRNYENSRDIFEEFKFTGLSNFSFLELDFVNGPIAVEEAVNE